MKKLIAVIAIFLAATIAMASDGYSLGTDGLWYYPGYTLGYTRTLITVPGYYNNGCFVAGRSYYSYTQVIANTTPPAYSKDWKVELIKYKEGLDDHAAYLASLRAMGINGQAYAFQSGYYGLPPVNASTQYSYSSIAQLYGDTNLSQLYQSSALLAQGAERLHGNAISGHQLLLTQEGANRARVAEILAKGQSGAQILKALSGPSTVITQSSKTVTGQPQSRNIEALSTLLQNKCASCHSGSVKKGGVDLADYLSFSQEQKERVWSAVTATDAKNLMPRNADNSPGQRLSVAELQLLFSN